MSIELGILKDLREYFLSGKPLILIDENREKEGDFVYPAELIDESMVEFFVRYGKGLFCLVAPEGDLLSRGFFKLPTNYGANYFIPIDFGDGTGISAYERAVTCRALANRDKKISEFRYPGHVMLIGSQDFSKRRGHSESSVELMKMCGFKPYSVIVEILNERGDSHDFDYLSKLAEKFELKTMSIKDVWRLYVLSNELIKIKSTAKLPTEYGIFEIVSFDNKLDYKEHFALVKRWQGVPLVRIHSECVTGDCLSSLRCDCGSQLGKALKMIEKDGGVLIYLRQEGRDIGLSAKISAYELQDKGLDTYEANVKLGFKPDQRDYAAASQILKALGIDKVRLLTNNPNKVKALESYGISVVERVSLYGKVTKFNVSYLKTKVEKFGHLIEIEGSKEVNL
ncbi:MULTISPECIES: bifunctional 3,4-dihydroxy-2-butanone-4-phosphate synthase/GTP cyclohydrolase II [Fervidobacterium]|uniref:GTP cyclohydrolase-2 n=1 Tax=Fervidobacterium nodosum (strain ATCC 35602 / DSM 5306 / Rt17-B1) TaxID=381764 RepID=A7HMX8_FERNB|nr:MULTISPECIES: bifunctional 3,4-dihydroxy-2-butanone-4-phosphate synthase/GTP cyclohydrolase II [Fervidobacterium]ABS61261.1 GTP cyclohydrolase II [Fervidobacterium nodosum Rt17-B1]